MEGLEEYYGYSDDEMDDELIQILDEIRVRTDDRTVASTCLQIQINAGVISEVTALHEMDDWKDAHYYNL